jgi:hypothetical protein
LWPLISYYTKNYHAQAGTLQRSNASCPVLLQVMLGPVPCTPLTVSPQSLTCRAGAASGNILVQYYSVPVNTYDLPDLDLFGPAGARLLRVN